jgi:hypothetical protein
MIATADAAGPGLGRHTLPLEGGVRCYPRAGACWRAPAVSCRYRASVSG